MRIASKKRLTISTVVCGIATLALMLGFFAMKPACPTRSVAFFSGYAGGWYCLATVEPRP